MGYLDKKLKAIISTLNTWKYYTGTLKTCTASSSGADVYGSSVAIGKNVKISQVYITLTYTWSGTGTTSYGCRMEGYNIATSAWETIGEISGTVTRPITKTLTGTVSNANIDNVYSHIRVYVYGGLYCTSRYGEGQIKEWYEKGSSSTYIPYVFPIRVNAGRFNFSWDNPSGRKWTFPAGTVLYSDGVTPITESTAEKPDVIIASNNSVVYLECDDWSGNYKLNDADTNNNFIGNIIDLPLITYTLNLDNCSLVTGDLKDLPALTYIFTLYNCSLITGDLSDLPAVTYLLSLSNCSLITGNLSDLPALTYYLNLYNCKLITGAYTQVNGNKVPTKTYLNYTGLSATDMDNTLIAYANCTKDNGIFSATNMTRTSASDTAVSTLTGRGWSITGITKV